jgi:trimethylamine--corrinoid protein Co-methyltransferase
MYHKLMAGLDLSDEALALDSIRDVLPGGHHLGTGYTLANFRTAFHRTELFDYNSAEQWLEEGAKDAETRAHAKYKQLLESYQGPELDPDIDRALLDFVARRKSEIKPEY